MNSIPKYVIYWVAIFFIASLASIMFFAVSISDGSGVKKEPFYIVSAYFSNIGTLHARSPVTSSGVLVGRVASIAFDNKNYSALVTLHLFKKYSFPEDSSLAIFTSGLLGEQYINIEPGASEGMLKEGSEIQYTQSAVVLEKLIGQFLVSKSEK
ncbi:MAG: outer membrane lipid asymmetry maintenance protein MlaD [Methylacidiphilales bacterium]|nr:outer membrane lipid asymmetry maintenance protein MlaD [Candidatus Methylacidiphilales bacterium]